MVVHRNGGPYLRRAGAQNETFRQFKDFLGFKLCRIRYPGCDKLLGIGQAESKLFGESVIRELECEGGECWSPDLCRRWCDL